jgi:hypothetical protein
VVSRRWCNVAEGETRQWWTKGRQWWRCGRRGTRGSCGAPQGTVLAGGGWERLVDNGISRRMPTVGKSGCPELLVVGSSLTVLLHPHGCRRVGFTVADDGRQSNGSRAESKTREHARGDESEVGELSLCAHARDKDGWPMWDGGDRWCTVTITSPHAVSRVRVLATGTSHLSCGYG